jgi:hypothetical protein
MNWLDTKFEHPITAIPVAVDKFADAGPGQWWFVHHPDGFLIECASEVRARQIAYELNAGRSSMQAASAQVRR